MSSPVAARMNRIKPGMCPHGMPAGACPICNGMGGAAIKKQQNQRKAGEMTWSECFAMGLRMKADKQRKLQIIQDRRDAHLAQLKAQEVLANKMQKLEMLQIMFAKVLPKPIAKIAENTIKFLAIPVLKFANLVLNNIQNIHSYVINFVNQVKENLLGVQEKLSAIFGEIFNAKEKSLSERFKVAKKKVFEFLFGKSEEKLEIKEIEEQENELELKKVKDSLMNLNKYKQEVEDELSSTV